MTSSRIVILLMATCLIGLPHSSTYNIMLFPIFTATNEIIFESLETQLTMAGHNVSYLIYEEDIRSTRPPHQALIIKTRGPSNVQIAVEEWETKAMTSWTETSASFPVTYLNALAKRCELVLGDVELMAKLMQSELDMILVDLWGNGVCGEALAEKLNVVVGGIRPSVTEPFTYYPTTLSLVPTKDTDAHDPSLAQTTVGLYSYYKQMRFWEDAYFQEAFKVVDRHLPGYQQMLSKRHHQSLAVIFVNSFLSLDSPAISLPPNTFFIGGIHCHVPSLLPKDLDNIARANRPGVILVNLVTLSSNNHYPDSLLNAVLDGLGKLPHVTFWKTNLSLSRECPNNIFLNSTYSLQDVMGHGRTRLAVTFCDRQTVIAAIFHHVPLLCIPVLEDQVHLAKQIQDKGIGLMLSLDKLTPETLKQTVLTIVANNSFHRSARYYSELLRDQPDTPYDRLVFWTEYVLRRKGAHHLRPSDVTMYVGSHHILKLFTLALCMLIASICAISCSIIAIRKLCLNKTTASKKKSE